MAESLPRDHRGASAASVAQVDARGGVGPVGPQQPGQDLATMGLAGLHGQVRQQGDRLVAGDVNRRAVPLDAGRPQQRQCQAGHLVPPMRTR